MPCSSPSMPAVRAVTSSVSAQGALITTALRPLRTKEVPCRFAKVATLARSKRPGGSTNAVAIIVSPAAIFGSHSCFCASLPARAIVPPATMTVETYGSITSALPNSSMITMASIAEPPSPP